MVSGSAEKLNCAERTAMVTVAVAPFPSVLVTVATYVVVAFKGNVAEPLGNVSWRSSASGSCGSKLIDTAFAVFQVKVVSWPATIVCGLAENEIVPGGAG